MVSTSEIQNLLTSGGTVVGTDGDKIGKVGQVFLDDATGNPEWVTVSTGLFGTAESFIPLTQASVRGDEIVVPYDKSTVKGAPRVEDANGHLSESEEAELYRYYGLDYTTGADTTTTSGYDTTETSGYDTSTTDAGFATTSGVAGTSDLDAHGTVGHDTSGPTTDDAMTRSEEQPRRRHRDRPDRPGPDAQVRRHRAADGDRPGRARAPRHADRHGHRRPITESVRKEEIELDGDTDTRGGTTGTTTGTDDRHGRSVTTPPRPDGCPHGAAGTRHHRPAVSSAGADGTRTTADGWSPEMLRRPAVGVRPRRPPRHPRQEPSHEHPPRVVHPRCRPHALGRGLREELRPRPPERRRAREGGVRRHQDRLGLLRLADRDRDRRPPDRPRRRRRDRGRRREQHRRRRGSRPGRRPTRPRSGSSAASSCSSSCSSPTTAAATSRAAWPASTAPSRVSRSGCGPSSSRSPSPCWPPSPATSSTSSVSSTASRASRSPRAT